MELDGRGRADLKDRLILIENGPDVSIFSWEYESQKRKEDRKEDGLEGDFGQEMQESFAAFVRAGQKDLERELEDSVAGGCDDYRG
jgi:hypothetical protein